MNNENWDDIRYALAVSKYGSLNSAAAALGVTHATVLRRVAAFEERNGCRIFQKNPSGYSVLPEANAIFSAMESVEDAVLSVERAVVGANRSPTRLKRSQDVCPNIEVPLWVATLEEIAQTPRFAVVQKALVERISEVLAK